MRSSSNPFAHPADQASGLRALFGHTRRCLVPVAASPFVAGSQALLETLSAALVLQGRRVLVVDAAASAPLPHESALFDLAAGVEPLTDQISYLAARGVPLSHVDTHGSAAAFVDAAFDAAPQADTVLLHADPTDLARLVARRSVRPLLLACDRPDAVKHAYACCKLLVQRCALMTFDLVLSAHPRTDRLPDIGARIASCADTFLGAVVQSQAVIDPLFDPLAARDAALARLVGGQLALPEPLGLPPALQASMPPARAVGAARSLL